MLYAAKRLALGLSLIAALSAILLFADRSHRTTAASPDRSSPKAADGPLRKKWRVHVIELNRVVDVEEAERGLIDGLRDAGLVEGRDYVKSIRDAQGDMATVPGLIDAALVEGTDLLMTLSTATLQAAIQRAKNVPVVFAYVSDPIAAGAGKSDSSHLPNVAGSYLISAVDQMIPILRAFLPKVHTIGTVYVPAEVNMVSQRDALLRVTGPAGLEVKAIAANTASEVGEAALALVAAHVDAIVQLPGNLTVMAFPSIAQAARRAKMPLFAFQTSQARGGALAVVARDYYDNGHEAAAIAARVMRGESPAAIPFVVVAATRLILNAKAAQEIGIALPQSIVSKAAEVIH